VYGVLDSLMAASTELITPRRSSTSTVLFTPPSRVKVEHVEEFITILSDDSDGNSPTVALFIPSISSDRPLSKFSQLSSVSPSLPMT